MNLIIFLSHGHSVLRLPPYHPDLNPIEMMWGIVKNYVAKKNVTFNMNDVIKLCEEMFSSITKEDCSPLCEKVIKVEDDYYAKEHIMDDTTDRLLLFTMFISLCKILLGIVFKNYFLYFRFIISVDGNSSDESDSHESVADEDLATPLVY